MLDVKEIKLNFPNRREWGSHLSALQSAAAYPKVIEALKSSREWFSQGAAQASSWLTSSAKTRDDFRLGHI